MTTPCPLCQPAAADKLIWQSPQLRVVWGSELEHPCLVQVIWQAHVQEMCELNAIEQAQVMQAVFTVEAAMKRVLQPKKLNMASLGNWVPHVHWHIIPRWEDDAHWPNSIWAAKQRDAKPCSAALKHALATAIVQALNTP